MKIIAHRGLENGPNVEIENDPVQIQKLIYAYEFEVEIDLWLENNILLLGHENKRKYRIENNFLFKNSNKLWIHAKNIEAANFLFKTDLNWFWHENDTLTLTSKNIIWNNVNFNNNIPGSVLLDFDLTKIDYKNKELVKQYKYICTDYPLKLLEIIQ